jgi:hypothetical protein
MIASVISFCTLDERFLEAGVQAARAFSDQVIISVCDHFFDGTPENFARLEQIYEAFPDCLFLEFAYDETKPYDPFTTLAPGHVDWGHHWHGVGRSLALYFLQDEIDYVFFMDADEIADPHKFKSWFEGFDYRAYTALRFSSYWYFREAHFQATTWPDAGLLIRKSALSPELILNPDERMGMLFGVDGNTQRLVHGLDGLPMVHHYSWVRTKEEMLRKTRAWAHHWERDWAQLIEEEFSRDFNGRDFVRKYKYVQVSNPYNPLALEEKNPLSSVSLAQHKQRLSAWPHVRAVSADEVFRWNLERLL